MLHGLHSLTNQENTMPYLGTQPAYTVLETGDIADDAITLAKMAAGTAGN